MILAVALAIAVGMRDARDRTIPNKLSALLAALGAAFQLARVGGLLGGLPWEAAVAAREPSPAVCAACATAVLVCGAGIELAHRARAGEAGMGMGDVKYLSAWVLVAGPAAVACFSAACLLGALCAVARHERDFALGPWISACCCAWLVMCL